jgi:tRNA (guanine26-N2/guanine27-N2)-dimethyltransferase
MEETSFPSEIVKEGKARIIVPKLKAFVKDSSDYAPSKAPVFYNPVMEFNRDIAVLAVQAFRRKVDREISICEPLTGSGIRGVRFATEIKDVSVLVSDITERAVKLALRNVELNGLQDRVKVEHKEANCLLSCHGAPKKRFDVVDVDPFGCPVPYLDSAVRALRGNGLLAITATDLAPLCGVNEKACVRKYGGKPLRTEYCHELGVRLLAGCDAIIAARHGIGVRILFSYCSAHYVRVYVKIEYGAKKADDSLKNLGYVLHCFNCFHRETTTKQFYRHAHKCPECGAEMDFAGPLWLGKIFDKQFCEEMAIENRHVAFRNSGRISKLLALAKNEAEAPMTYYVLDHVSDKLSLPVPSLENVRRILCKSGFLAIPTHFNSRGLRTDAPALVIQKVLQKAVERN